MSIVNHNGIPCYKDNKTTFPVAVLEEDSTIHIADYGIFEFFQVKKIDLDLPSCKFFLDEFEDLNVNINFNLNLAEITNSKVGEVNCKIGKSFYIGCSNAKSINMLNSFDTLTISGSTIKNLNLKSCTFSTNGLSNIGNITAPIPSTIRSKFLEYYNDDFEKISSKKMRKIVNIDIQLSGLQLLCYNFIVRNPSLRKKVMLIEEGNPIRAILFNKCEVCGKNKPIFILRYLLLFDSEVAKLTCGSCYKKISF